MRRYVGRRSTKRNKDRSTAAGGAASAAAAGAVSTASSLPVTAVTPTAVTVEGAEVPTARTAALPTEKGKGCLKTPKPTGGNGGGGASRRKKGGTSRSTASTNPATIPEYDIYSSSNTSFQAECKRRALLDLARADMDRVNVERDFLNKNSCFNDAKASHIMIHERWVQSKGTLEAACNASNFYFGAVERTRQKHVAACRDRQAAEAGVRDATIKSEFAQTAMLKAKEAFRAAKQRTAAHVQHLREKAATAAAKASGTCAVGSGGQNDDAGSSGHGSSGNSRKRSHLDFLTEDLPSNAINLVYAAEATKHVVGGGGSGNGGRWEWGWGAQEGHRPAKSRSATGIHALSQEEERHLRARGLQAQRKIRARFAALQAADAVAKASSAFAFAAKAEEAQRMDDGTTKNSNRTPLLQVGLGVVTSELAVAARNMNVAIEAAKRASADVGSGMTALDLPWAVRAEAETAAAHQNAMDNAWPYVSWVNNEVEKERSLNSLSETLAGTASLAWDAREEARKKLNEAGEALSTAVRILKSFSRGDKVDISRDTLFKIVVETSASSSARCNHRTLTG